jgi:PAS domain-containing protein
MSMVAGLLLAAFGVGVLFDALILSRARRAKDRAALRAIELRNSALLRAMPDLMFVHARDGTYLDYHAKDPSDLLAPPEVFIGKRMADIMPPALHAIFQRCFDEAMETGGPAVAEYDLWVRDELRHYEARVVTGDDETLVSIVRDVTDAKRTTEKLRKSDEFNRRIIESSNDGIKVLDLEGRLKWMSRTALRQVDLEEFTIENLRIPDFLSDNDRQAALEALARARSPAAIRPSRRPPRATGSGGT